METLVVKLSPEAYQALRERAARENKSVEALSSEVLEKALAEGSDGALTVRAMLEAAGRVASLGPGLRQRIIPGVSLKEVRESLASAGGPSLSEIILEQRGSKP
jgi:plasmid stability protein